MLHMKEMTKKSKAMEKVLPETKADDLLFGQEEWGRKGAWRRVKTLESGLCHTQNDADSTPQMTHRGALMSHATVILPRVQQKDWKKLILEYPMSKWNSPKSFP